MCCIGFLSLVLGADKAAIENREVIAEVFLSDGCVQFSNALTQRQRHDLETAYETNDTDEIDDPERKRKLRTLGRKFGVKFVFSQGRTPPC